MPTATFDTFQTELARLVESFAHNLAEHKKSSYVEAQLRDDFLNPFFAALGWDITNSARLIQKHREVEIESRTQIAGRQKRADYLFRVAGRDRFVCEAKKPAEELHAKHSFQAKRYAWNKELPLALLTDFEDFKLFVVGGKPHVEDGEVGLYRKWHFKELTAAAKEIWDLLARDSVAAGSIEKLIENLPKKSSGKGKYKQGWLIKPDRSRSLDVDFLNFLDEARRELASDLLKENADERADLLDGHKLNEATQRILDRILFLRICEDRDIDTGMRLDSHLQTWRRATGKDETGRRKQEPLNLQEEPAHYGGTGIKAPKESLWRSIVRHFRNLDRRPPSHVPFFNGNLFKPHFSEEMIVSDDWLARFVGELSADESPYLFAYIPVEILGTIYERFLGKVVVPHGRGVKLDPRPDLRHDTGVYYTPRYVVEFIVAQTVEKLLEGKKPDATSKLRFLDPACGSGSFLIRVFEALCDYWQQYLTDHPDERKKKWCWVEKKPNAATDDVHLTMALKRQILLSNVFGVDLDPGAVEVTQLSLYLKMLEDETRNSLQKQRDLLPDDDDPLLPPLDQNIKCGNSLIASDFSMIGQDLVQVRAFDWNVSFREILKLGGFDAVIGNPPWGALFDEAQLQYLREKHKEIIVRMIDSFMYFTHASFRMIKRDGFFGMILPDVLLYQTDNRRLREFFLKNSTICVIGNMGNVFDQVTRPACILVAVKTQTKDATVKVIDLTGVQDKHKQAALSEVGAFSSIQQSSLAKIPGSLFLTSQFAEFAIWEKVMSLPITPLSSLIDGDGIQRGVSPDFKDAFLVTEQIAREWKLEKQNLRRVLTGGKHVKRYDIVRPDLLLIYTQRDDDFQKLPRICSFIDQFKRDITCKEVKQGKHNLYALHRARDEKIFTKPKKFIGVITEDQVVVAIDRDRTFATDGLYLFSIRDEEDDRYLLALLNSKLFILLYRLIAFEEGRALAQVKPTVLANLPIRAIRKGDNREQVLYNSILKNVDRMQALVPQLRLAKRADECQTLQNAVAATDQQIDALVYELYGLTEEEIKIVEGNA